MRGWVRLVGLLSGLVACTGVAFAEEAGGAAEHRRRAAEYQEAGKLVEAAVELRSAVQLALDNAADHRALASLYLQLNDPQSALREYQEVVRLEPDDGEARLQTATMLLLDRQFEEASDHARKAVELQPERFEGYALLGRARLGMEDLEGAAAAARRAAELAPDNEVLWVELARLHVSAEQPERAESVLREGLAAVPPSATLRAALANLLAQQQRFEEADRLMGEVENLSMGNPGAVKAVALYRIKRGDAPGAEALLQRALTGAGENPQARLQALAELANFYSLIGDLPQARDALQQVQELAPDHILTKARLANLYLLEGDDAAAAPLVAHLLEQAPGDRNARLLNARLNIAQGQLEQGTETLEEIVGEAPDSVNAHLFLGKAYALAGRWERARAAYLKVLEEVPAHFFALLDLAKVNLELGRPEDAVERADQVLRAQPGNSIAKRVKIRGLLLSGQAAAAEELLRALLEHSGDDPALHLQLGQVLAAQGRHDAGLAAFRRARELAPAAVEPLLQEMGALARLGNLQEVAPAAQRFLETNGEVPVVLNALAAYHLGRGERDAARPLVQRSLAVDPGAAETRELEARLGLATGDLEAAEAALGQALEADPQRTSSLLLLAGVYEGTRRGGDAAVLYRRILGYAPGNPVAANNLAVLYSAEPERRAEALELAQQAVAAAPDNPFTRDTLGWVQHLLGSPEEAVRNLEHARSALPEHPEVAYHLGAVYAALGDRDEQAAQLLREALDSASGAGWEDDVRRLLQDLSR